MNNRSALTAALTLLITVVSCHSSNDPIPASTGPILVESGTIALTDLVRLTTRSVVGDVITIDVVIDGPTTSQNVGAFYFDIVLGTPDAVEFEGFVSPEVNFFGAGGWQANAVPLADGHALSVVNKTGIGSGVGSGSFGLVSLAFRIDEGQATELRIDRSTLNGSATPGPIALDIDGVEIDSIDWDTSPALIQG